jgi:hypothetical protein
MKNVHLVVLLGALLCILYILVSCLNTLSAINDRVDRANVEYQFVVEDSDLIVYDGNRVVGRVKIEGQLEELITEDNQ